MENKLYHSPKFDLVTNKNNEYEPLEKIAKFFKVSLDRVKRSRKRANSYGIAVYDRLYDHYKICYNLKQSKDYNTEISRNIQKLIKDDKLVGIVYQHKDKNSGRVFTVSVQEEIKG